MNYYLDGIIGKVLAEIDKPFYSDGTPAEKEIVEDFLSEDFPKNSRYIRIPITEQLKSVVAFDEENHVDMQVFVNFIEDKSLKQQLQKIIDSKCSNDFALQQFLEIVKRKPERKLWVLFREKQQEKREEYLLKIIDECIISFLEDNNIEDNT